MKYNDNVLEQRREELIEAAKSRPGVAEAARVFEAAASQAVNGQQFYGSTPQFATSANR